MLDFLNRHVVQPIYAAKAGSRHLQYLRTLRRTQFDPPEIVRARQLAALQAILHHAFDTVPFYRAAWTAAGVHPNDVKDLADLRHFPIVTKTDLRTRAAEFHSEAYRGPYVTKRTSGSTGVPLTIRLDEPGKQWKYAGTLRGDEWSGWRLGQRVAKLWGNPEYRHSGFKGRLRNAILDRAVHLDTVRLTDGRMREFVTAIRWHRPGLLFGHAHSLYLIADRLKKQGIDDVRPNGIVSTAMPLHDWQRKTIEEVFGTKATDRYGCEETSLIAGECEVHRGLHVNADSVHVEVESGEPTGPLLVTDLCNQAMPLIRYRNGDHVTLTDRVCSCGRGLPLIEKVEGRDADYVVTPTGSLISGISLTENFACLIEGTAQVQIVQEAVTHLRLRIVPSEAFGVDSRRQIARLVGDTFGPTMRHEIELVDAIPQEPGGKYRFCISKVAPAAARALR
ncbi:MAG: phenylacetate--CoA ligase family protein [Planctomycetia bacterium]|nr:phenylacetate--CoA ligase family protein [Planctomycetia bacterium]